MDEIETLRLIEQKEQSARCSLDLVHYLSTFPKGKRFTHDLDYKAGRELIKMRLCKICPDMTVRVTRKARARLAEVRGEGKA